VLKVPELRVSALKAPSVNALPNVQTPPTPLHVTLPFIVVPFVVKVREDAVAVKLRVPVALQTVPATKDNDPLIINVPVLVNVTVPAETVRSRQVNVPVNVTV
jgi:hypothetical protein